MARFVSDVGWSSFWKLAFARSTTTALVALDHGRAFCRCYLALRYKLRRAAQVLVSDPSAFDFPSAAFCCRLPDTLSHGKECTVLGLRLQSRGTPLSEWQITESTIARSSVRSTKRACRQRRSWRSSGRLKGKDCNVHFDFLLRETCSGDAPQKREKLFCRANLH